MANMSLLGMLIRAEYTKDPNICEYINVMLKFIVTYTYAILLVTRLYMQNMYKTLFAMHAV